MMFADQANRARLRAFLSHLLDEANLGADHQTIKGIVENTVATDKVPLLVRKLIPTRQMAKIVNDKLAFRDPDGVAHSLPINFNYIRPQLASALAKSIGRSDRGAAKRRT